jgi:tetratricopeptide (TPR) repeat protein
MKECAENSSPVVGDRHTRGDSSHDASRADSSSGGADVDTDFADLDTMSQEGLLDRLCEIQVKRWRAGERVPAEAYLALHPGVQPTDEAAFELIYGEFLLREELGESPPLEEFQQRFPRFAARLQRQLELHGAFRSTESIPLHDRNRYAPSEEPEGVAAVAYSRSIVPGFKILGELGHGGMGLVYKAWQVRLKRVVALKVIRADAYADSAVAARFHAEAEAAARFQHPNIIQVFEVGEHDGMGYLVLEYAPGGGLDRRLAGLLQDSRDSARLTETLARAIHYAHQQGIVHRDLKPANVLLTEDAVPKISDFGLAKLLERGAALTEIGDILGTPSYMAPEQARGLSHLISLATDVYALGAILYEMLTGRPPFKGTTPLSTMEQVSSQEPLAPGKLQRHTPRDLEIICLKCLEKEPRRRYGNALELAEDLRRFLNRQPIIARPTPAWERIWKWARRRPSAATGLFSALVTIILLLAGAWYYSARLRAAVRTARAAEQASFTSALAAVEQRNLALKAFHELVYGVQEKLGQTPATRVLQQALLNTAIAGLEEIAHSTAGSAPDLSQAVAHQKLGDIFRIIGRFADARRHYDWARTLAQDLRETAPSQIAIEEALYQTHMGLGLLNISARKYGDAQSEFLSAVASAELIVAAQPLPNGRHQALIEAYLQLGRALSFAGEHTAAQAWFTKMHDLAQRWVSEEPENLQARDLLASSFRKLADLKKFSKDYLAARENYHSAIDIGRSLLLADPGNFAFKSHLSTALDDLAGVLKEEGELDSARQLFQEAGRLFAELVESDPERLESRLALLHTQLRLAGLERDNSQFAKAAEIFHGAAARLESLQREGRLEGSRISFTSPRELTSEIAFCEAAPRALRDFEFARSQPVGVAARLLRLRARTLGDGNASTQVAATAQAICKLQSDEPELLYDLARNLGLLITDLDQGRWRDLPRQKRQALRQRCADRAAELLVEAHRLGFNDFDRLTNSDLSGLRRHPAYEALIARLKRR